MVIMREFGEGYTPSDQARPDQTRPVVVVLLLVLVLVVLVSVAR